MQLIMGVRMMLRLGMGVLILGLTISATAQMAVSDVRPGMERKRVLQELLKRYKQEDDYEVSDREDATFISHWIKRDGKIKGVKEIGLVTYTAGRVDIVEENYEEGSIQGAPALMRAITNELRSMLKAEAPPKGGQTRQTGTASVVLNEFANPELGGSSSSLIVMFGPQGINVTLTDWRIGDDSGSYVELARRREAVGR